MIHRDKFLWTTRNNFLFQGTLEAFVCSGILDKAVLSLGEQQGMLVKNECSSWYNRVGNFFVVGLGGEE